MPLKFDLEGALAEPASGLKFDIELALSPSVGRTPPQDQPLESDLAGIVQPRQELRQKPIGERIAGMRPAPAEIRNSPSTIYKADNPVLNAALGVPRAFVHGAEQVIQAGAGFTGNEQARKASERRVQGLMLESDFPDLEQGAGSMLAIAPAALINPALGAAVGGGLAAGPAIGEGMEAGLSTPEAIAYGVGQGGLEYLTERIPLGILFGKGGAHVAERLVKAFFPEATGEQIATLTQDALRQSVIEPNKPWSEYWAERGEAAKRTLIATAGGLGAAGAIQAGVQRLVPQTNQFADVLDEVVRGTTIKPAGLDIVQDLYDRGRTRFANVPVQPQPELNVPGSASTLAQQPIQAAPLTAQVQAAMPDEYAGPGGYAIPQGEADALQEQIPAEVDVREQARDGEEVAIGDTEVQAPAEKGRPQEVAFDVSGRTDEQLAWLAEHGKPGWKEAAIAEGERRGIAPSATTQTTAQTPQQPAPKAKKPRKTGPSNNLIRRIHQLGGINLRYLPDVAGERKVQRGMPVGLFRKNGMGLDDLSRMLADEGFPINIEDPTDIDGVRQLTELLQKTLSGGTVLNYSGQQAMLDAMAKAEAEIDAPERTALDDPEAIAEREAIKQADIAIQGVTNDELDALLDAAFNDERTPNAILSDEEIDQLFASASDTPQTQPEGQDADSVAGSPEAESFALDAYTPEDLKQREVQPEPERPEAPSPADFVLSGSNRQADEAEARGQTALPGTYTVSEPATDEYTHDLFGNPLPDKPRARGSRAQQQPAKARDVDTASSVPPGQYGTTTKLITHATREIGATNVSTVDEAATALSYLGRGAVERFDALVTDKNGKPLALVGSFKGALTQTSVYPSTVIAEAFRIPGAANIWFAHNHPSGTPELSQADRWLTSQLENVFEGTGINTHGTFAITNDGRYTHTDGGRGTIKPAKSTMRLDAVEREFDKFDKLGAAFSDPAAAQTEMRVMGLKGPGLVLLDTQNAPIAFIPMGGMEAMPLKHNGRLDALYRAISYANAGAAVIYDPRGDFTEAQYRNIGAALGQVDVKLLDVFQKGVSMAEKGRPLVASTLLSRGPNAAGMSVESATSLLRKRFGKRIDKMLESGTLKIVATPAELPAWGKGQRGIGGAWDGTTAWIVASQASPETLAATYLHEVGEHAGMQEMLGDKYQDIITRLDDLIWDGDATANRAASRVPKDTPAKDVQHERLAYFIEEAQRARDAKPQTLSTKARQLLQDIIAAIRAWAYRQFGGITLTEADILALARQSAKQVADRAGQAQGQTAAEAMLQKVWHGTPHIWAPEPGFPHGRPRLDKMGTGEGAQAYGWGWYSAEAPDVAQTYKQSADWRQKTMDKMRYLVDGKEVMPKGVDDGLLYHYRMSAPDLFAERIQYLEKQKAGSLDQAKYYAEQAKLGDDPERYARMAKRAQDSAKKFDEELQLAAKLQNQKVEAATGQLYQLDIPDDVLPYLLDWNKPLSEQTPEVRDALKRGGSIAKANPRMSGREIYESVARNAPDAFGLNGKSAQQVASEYLASIGIVGNRYLDGQSRNRPLKDIKREFLAELPEDADAGEVAELIGTGKFSPKNDALLRALRDDDWLGFDYPAQAVSAALGKDLGNYGASPELIRAVEDAQEGGTYNFVIWDQPTLDKIALLERNGEKLDAMREAEVQMSRTGTINVDGVDRPTTNSNGQRIAQTEEGLRNFWRWFGDSKVVDNEGRPLVVYHGTDNDFSVFDKNRLGENTLDEASSKSWGQTSRVGFWFNSHPMAKSPEKYGAGFGLDMPVYLLIKTPKKYWGVDWLAGEFEPSYEHKRGIKGSTLRKKLIKHGADGAVMPDEEFGGTSYVVFSPTQIKSAIGNRGTFDPASPDIRFSKEPQSTDAEEMAKKFGFAIKGMADARIQPSAERAYIENQEMFERMKRGVVSNADSKKAGEALAAEVGWSPDSVDAFMKEAAQKGTPPVDILAAMFAMSRMQSVKLLEAQNPTQFIEYTMDVLRTLMATRAYGSEMGRALQFIGAMERMGGYTAADVTSEGGSLPRVQIVAPGASTIAIDKDVSRQTADLAKEVVETGEFNETLRKTADAKMSEAEMESEVKQLEADLAKADKALLDARKAREAARQKRTEARQSLKHVTDLTKSAQESTAKHQANTVPAADIQAAEDAMRVAQAEREKAWAALVKARQTLMKAKKMREKAQGKAQAMTGKEQTAKQKTISNIAAALTEENLRNALGGDKGIQKIMAAMHKQGKDVDLGMLVSYLSGMVDSIAKEQSENRSTLNKLMAMHVERWRANILTGLFTHEVNVTSNAVNMLIEFGLVNPIQEMLPGGIGLGGYIDALKAMGGYRKVLADIWALMKYNAFEEAPASRLSHLLDQRDPELLALMRGTGGSKWADSHRKFIPGLAGKVIRGAGFVPLAIEDAIFKVIPFRYELARQQAAGEQRNVTAAIDAANKLTFQDGTGMLGMVVAKMHEKAPYSEFWITFVKTMTNLIKRSFDLTPGLSQAKNWDALIGKEGDKARREAIALSIVGVGIASMVMALMGDDDDEVQLSGFAPYDRLKKLLWLEEHDNIGLRIGDDVYPFYRMSPLAEPAGLTIGAYNSIKQGEAGPLFNAMYQSIVTKHFMAKIADLIDGIEEVARAEGNEKSEAGERLVRRQLGGIVTGTLIPAYIAQLGDMTDAEKREVNTIMQDLQKKIPGLRESLPSKLKVTGEVLGEPRYMSPFPVQGKPVKKDEVTRWLLKLGRGIDPNPKSIKDLPHDVRQTLLRERWEFLGYAYEASKDLDAEAQEKIISKMLSAWTENAKAARVMHELEIQAD